MKSKASKIEISNVKDAILMPPPKAPTKSRSDTSEELRRNLIETAANLHDNSILHEELSKIINREETSSYDSTNKYKNYPSINFHLIHDNYNSISDDDLPNDINNRMEKLKNNLAEYDNKKSFIPFKKLSLPNSKRQIKYFVENLIDYLNKYDYDNSLMLLKIKIVTRYNDFKNKGLKQDYFKECLFKMQNELIDKISPQNEEMVIKEDYQVINKKRERTLCEMKSVTSSSSSSDN